MKGTIITGEPTVSLLRDLKKTSSQVKRRWVPKKRPPIQKGQPKRIIRGFPPLRRRYMIPRDGRRLVRVTNPIPR